MATEFNAGSFFGRWIFALVLVLGMSWSHIRRRMTGQVDVDRMDN